MTATIRPLTAEDRISDALWPLLWDGIDDAVGWAGRAAHR